MRVILLFVLIGSLAGCAGTMDALNPKPIHPNVGDGFDAVNKMSNAAGTGDLVEISDSLGGMLYEGRTYTGTPGDVYGSRQKNPIYDPYKFYRSFQRNFIDHTILQPITPRSDILVFRQSKLVLISEDANSLARDMQSLIEDDKRRAYYGADFDLANKIHADFGAWASKDDVANLHALNVNGVGELDAAEAESRNYKELYRSTDAGDLFRYLVDKAIAKNKNLTIAQAAQIRKAEEEKAAQQREKEAARELAKSEAEAARQRAAHAKEFPFEAVLSCDFYGQHADLVMCFKGEHDVNTELELTNGEQYRMYTFMTVQQAGEMTSDRSLVIPLRRNFSLKAQNAQKSAILSLVVRETKTGKILFQKSAAHFGVISVKN